ncbi:hypothetical protein BpHYR1_036127 [Brachionus plicatilis]|uniref:Uncharacterized protein n=1 Tax=Brachionus plicatilis TaxID=10195 RepID=A0A3M7S5U1_BRAPC|nr:hypothetical protein BpHYR1_036127 [Brachionus plicatilis]
MATKNLYDNNAFNKCPIFLIIQNFELDSIKFKQSPKFLVILVYHQCLNIIYVQSFLLWLHKLSINDNSKNSNLKCYLNF